MKWRLLLLFLSLGIFSQSIFAVSSSENDSYSLVVIKGYKFIPQVITIKRGKKIRWVNHEKRQYHNVWFETSGEDEPEDYLFSGDSYQREFNKTGTFPYRCGPHPEMKGRVHVVD